MKRHWIVKYFAKDHKRVIVEGYFDTKKKAIKRNGDDANSRIISMHECTDYCGSDVDCKCYLNKGE